MTLPKMELKVSFGTIPMLIEADYSSFEDFYKNEKHNIYSKILDVFDEILKENIKESKLLVVARIDGVIFDTDFKITKDNKDLLIKTVMPYFEEIEEYETCQRIKELLSCLSLGV